MVRKSFTGGDKHSIRSSNDTFFVIIFEVNKPASIKRYQRAVMTEKMDYDLKQRI